MTKWCSVFMACFVMLFGTAPARASAQKVQRLEEITIEAEPIEPKLEVGADGNTEVISTKENKTPVVSTVPDVLDKTQGISVQRRSILTPKNSQVRLRGLDESRYNVLVDGRLLNGTGVYGGYYVDWSTLPLTGWKDVNVSKGAFSAKYGNTLGGTVNLVPASPAEGLHGDLSGGYKRYGTFGTSIYGSERSGQLAGAATAGFDTTDGNLKNSAAQRQNYSGTVYYYPAADGELRASFRFVDGDFNLPVQNWNGTAGYDSDYPQCSGSRLVGPGVNFPNGDTYGDGSYYVEQRYAADLTYKQTLMGFNTETVVYYNHVARKDILISRNLDEKVLERESSPDNSWGWSARFSRALGANLLGFGGQGVYLGHGDLRNTYVKQGYFKSPLPDSGAEEDASKWHGFYLDDTLQLSEQLELYGGLRVDVFSADNSVDAATSYKNGKPTGYQPQNVTLSATTPLPKFGVVYRPVKPLALYGRVGRATRFPTTPEFYWYYAGYRPEVDSNSNITRKDLTYEDAVEFETGLSYQFRDEATLWLTYYNYQVDDYIRTIFGYAPSRIVYNIDGVRLQGIELAADGRIWGDVFAFANFTYQKTHKSGDVLDGSNALSDSLSELPEYMANWGLKYQREDGAMAKITFRYVGPTDVPVINDTNMANGVPLNKAVQLQHLGGFATVDLLFRYPVVQYAAGEEKIVGLLSAGVENLLDKDYVEEYYFPAPGRSFNVSLELKF